MIRRRLADRSSSSPAACSQTPQVPHRRGRVARGHQRLADQDGVVAGVGAERGGIGPVADARLGHADRAVGQRRRQPDRPGRVDLEGDEVALVDPDQVGAGRDRPLELGLVVDLDQRVEADLGRPDARYCSSSPAPSAAAISSTASAPMSRASTTSWAETVKSLRSTGQLAGRSRPRPGRPGEPPKNSLVGQHRQAGGAAGLVVARPARPGRGRAPASPFDGERRLTSAMTAISVAAVHRAAHAGSPASAPCPTHASTSGPIGRPSCRGRARCATRMRSR